MDSFVKKYSVKDSSYNHLLLTYPFGKLYIPNESIDELNEMILKCKKENIDFGICEVHNDEIPEIMYFDLDFLLKEPVDITDSDIKKFITVCNEVFAKSTKDANTTAYVYRKPVIEKDHAGYHYKNGLHVYFPNVYLYAKERKFIHQQVVEEAERKKLFSQLPHVCENMNIIIDPRVIRTNAIIKIDCNKPNKKRYELYQIFDSKGEIIKQNHTDLALIHLLSIRKNILRPENDRYRTIFTAEIVDETPVQQSDPFFSKRMIKSAPSKSDIEQLVSMLDMQRCQNYSTWIQVGLCLHNIDDTLIDVWKSWSSQVPSKASKTRFNELWKSFRKKDNGVKYGSLVSWAKADSPDKFKKFRDEQVTQCIKKSLDFTIKTVPYPIDIARVLKEKFGDIYVCASITGKKWYEFRDTIWVEVQQGYTLFNQITDYLINEYVLQDLELNKKLVELKGESINCADESKKSSIDSKVEDIKQQQVKINRIISNLKKTPFKRQVMEEAASLFFDEKFEQNLNQKKNILVFNNGIYDFELGVLREGRPSDYMTYSTYIDYKEFDENDPDIQKVLHIFSQIHPNEEMRNFFFSTLGLSLHGHKVEQKCNIWTGNGSNGKSITADLCHKALGDFFHSPNITLFTRKAGASGNASPEKMVLKGRRIGILQEPECDDKLNTSIMKQITGNDMIEARPLYGETIRFKPQISIFISCNDLPKIDGTDGGTWRRVRVVPFKSKFVDNPTQPNEYLVDPHLTDQLDYLAESFMSILVHYYTCVKNNNFVVKEPKEVTSFTNDYKNDNNTYQDFVSQHLESTKNEKDKVKIVELYEMFKDWVKSNNPSVGCVSRKDFQRQISRVQVDGLPIGEPKTAQSWLGYKIKNLEEDDDFKVVF